MSSSARRRARYRRYALRLVAVAAFGGTAALAVVLTRMPQQASLAAESIYCTASGLAARIGAAAGGYSLDFTNISHRTCVLDGYPSVDAYVGPRQAGPRQVGTPATLDTSVRPRTVTLAPGGTAHATLRYTGTGHATCRRGTAFWLRVYPPHQTRAMFVRWHLPACSRLGPHVLIVAAIQPRSGMLRSPKF